MANCNKNVIFNLNCFYMRLINNDYVACILLFINASLQVLSCV